MISQAYGEMIIILFHTYIGAGKSTCQVTAFHLQTVMKGHNNRPWGGICATHPQTCIKIQRWNATLCPALRLQAFKVFSSVNVKVYLHWALSACIILGLVPLLRNWSPWQAYKALGVKEYKSGDWQYISENLNWWHFRFSGLTDSHRKSSILLRAALRWTARC